MFKFITEFAPLIAFFIGYKTGSILDATLYLLVATIISSLVSYIVTKKINKTNIISVILLLISAGLTLFSGDSTFIKMKPTLLYIIFALILLFSHFRAKTAIEYVMGGTIAFPENKYWRKLNLRFFYYFIFMAILNELIWRNFAENIWVNFKVFGALPLTLIFVALQLPFIIKHSFVQDETRVNHKK